MLLSLRWWSLLVLRLWSCAALLCWSRLVFLEWSREDACRCPALCGAFCMLSLGVGMEGRRAVASRAAPDAVSCLASRSCPPMMAGDPKGDFPSTLSALLREGARCVLGSGARGFELK